MTRWRRVTTAFTATAALALAGVLAVSALGVLVYKNNFSSKAEFSQITRSGGGKSCDRRYRGKQNVMLASVKKGSLTCSYRVPVQGDGDLPNHAFGVDAKILKDTPRATRGSAFVELSLRTGGGGVGYTLRIFPEKKKFELTRGPKGGGFPARGESKAIKRTGARNRISLVAKGARVTAKVNGKQLASLVDSDPGQVSGRKLRFAVGNKKNTKKDVIAVVKSVSVGVPTN